MFLTTNRVAAFDVAFQSRIDLMLYYDDLDLASRRSVWALLLGQVAPPPTIAENDLDTLAERTINGRQIKNAVKAAQLLAADEEAVLSFSHIEVVLKAMFPTMAMVSKPPSGALECAHKATPAAPVSSSSIRTEGPTPCANDDAAESVSSLTRSKRARAFQLRRRWKKLTSGGSRE